MSMLPNDESGYAEQDKLVGMSPSEFAEMVEGRLTCPSFDEIDRYARSFVSGSDTNWANTFRRPFERHISEDRCALCETLFCDLKVAAAAAANAAGRAVA